MLLLVHLGVSSFSCCRSQKGPKALRHGANRNRSPPLMEQTYLNLCLKAQIKRASAAGLGNCSFLGRFLGSFVPSPGRHVQDGGISRHDVIWVFPWAGFPRHFSKGEGDMSFLLWHLGLAQTPAHRGAPDTSSFLHFSLTNGREKRHSISEM